MREAAMAGYAQWMVPFVWAAVFTSLAAFAGPSAGRAIFEGKGACVGCHAIENRGGSLGPDLSDAGVLRTAAELRLALTDPGAEIEPPYLTVTVVTRGGARAEGIRLNEDDISIQLRDATGRPRAFLKDNLRKIEREARSLMPSMARRLSAEEIDQVVDYLRSLKGTMTRPGEIAARLRSPAPVSERIDWLDRPERDADERPGVVLDALRIPRGATVADVGAGTGYFTWRLAERAGPAGKVIAVEIQPKMLDRIAREVKVRNLENVELVTGSETDPRLPPGAVDLVFIANAYHEFSRPEAMMAAVRRALKPGGRLAVLEYRKENTYTPLEESHKMTLREVRSEMEAMGFQTGQVLTFLPAQHLVIFTKRQDRGLEEGQSR